MNEQELGVKIYDAWCGNTPNEDIVEKLIDIAKAYADAQVDAAVGRAMNEVGRISVEYNTRIAAKDTEITELKASLSQVQQMYTDLLVGTTDAISAKDAEIKRLRDGIKWAVDSMEFRGVTKGFKTEWHPSFEHGILKPLLPPAPVTEDKFSVNAYPKECAPTIEQLTENDGMSMMERLEKRMPPFHKVASVTEPPSGILQTILALPDDTSAAYIKSVIYDQLKRA